MSKRKKANTKMENILQVGHLQIITICCEQMYAKLRGTIGNNDGDDETGSNNEQDHVNQEVWMTALLVVAFCLMKLPFFFGVLLWLKMIRTSEGACCLHSHNSFAAL
jgi:hypothetical protein